MYNNSNIINHVLQRAADCQRVERPSSKVVPNIDCEDFGGAEFVT